MRGVLASLAVVVLASTSVAQPASEAERLFQEGLELMAAGKAEQACAKFEQSIKKDPRAVGTLMNLGRCNANIGKVATALELFKEARDRASEAGMETTRATAIEQIAALSARVPVLTFERDGSPVTGETIVLDDRVLSNPSEEQRVDPGSHTLVVTAPGRLPFEHQVSLTEGERVTITIPILAVPKDRTVIRSGSATRTIGKVAVFGGLGLGLGGLGLGFYAKRDYDQLFEDPDGASGPAQAPCGHFPNIGDKPACDPAGHSRAQRDRNLAIAGSIVGVVGAAAAVTGLVMWLAAPESESSMIVPTGDDTSAGVMMFGRF